jgi:hypothetical protein
MATAGLPVDDRARRAHLAYAPTVIDLRRTAALLLSALVLAGCSSKDSDHDAERMSQRHPSQPATTDTGPPRGMQWVDSETGLRFAAPESWTVLEGSSADDPAYADEIQDYADQLGISTDKVKDMMRDVDVRVIGPDATTMNVSDTGAPRLPSTEALREALRQADPEVTVRAIDTPLGPGLLAHFHTELRGLSLLGVSIYVGADDGIANLTISSTDAARTEQLSRQVIKTIDVAY